MALDPTAPTGWGLGSLGAPLGAPSSSTAPLAPQPIYTPEQIAQMRQHAMALQQPPEGGIHHWTQGLAELARAIQGNREADFARQAEATGRQQGASAIGQIYAPYLSPGGASPSAAGAAPAGSTGSGSAGAISSADDQSIPKPAATTMADASAPRGIRNNNPLNIEDGDFAKSQPGYTGSDGRFATFAAPEHGVAAADTLLNTYQTKHGLNTVAGIVGRWAPASDHNDMKAYATHVASQLGIGPNDPVPPEMRPQLIAAMAQHENGRPLAAPATTGLLAPIHPSAAPLSYATPGNTENLPKEITQGASVPFSAAAPPMPPQPAAPPAPPSAFDTGTSAVPNLSPMVNAIAGRPMPPAGGVLPPGGVPWNPDDFKRQVAAMEAAKGPMPPLTPAEQAMMALVKPGAMPPAAGLPATGVQPPNGQQWSPDAFKAQVAAMEAAKGNPAADTTATPPASPDGTLNPPLNPTEQAMMAMVRPGTGPLNPPLTPTEQQMMAMVGRDTAPNMPVAVPPVTASPIVPPSVPLPQARPAMAPPPFLVPGSSIPGAVGPTSVGGAPLNPAPRAVLPPPVGPVSVNGQQLPTSGASNLAPMVSAIAGRNLPPNAAPTAGIGSPSPPVPTQVAQAGSPTTIAPSPDAPPSGLPQPLTSPVGQITQEQLTRTLANPWVPESAKAAMLQMIQQRGQPQSMPVEGGTLMFNSAGQRVFIPEPRFGTVKIGSAEVPTVSHFNPDTKQWTTTTLAPGGGVQTAPSGPLAHPAQAQGAPNQPDLSTIGGIQANEVAQAGAKKAAEVGAETGAKYYDSLHKGLAGSAMIAAQQKQNIDMLRQVAASPNFTPGAGSEAALALQRVAAQLGINPEGAAPREIFNQVATRILADQMSGIKSMASETGETGGRIFKSMLDLEEKANITPEDTAAGINAKLNLIDHAGDLMMKWGDMADDYVKDHGKLDPGFDKTLRGEIAKARIPNAVPQESPAASAAPISKTIGDKTYYQIGGKWFDNPEGK